MLDDFAVNFAILRILSKKDFAISKKILALSNGLGEVNIDPSLKAIKWTTFHLLNRTTFQLESTDFKRTFS